MENKDLIALGKTDDSKPVVLGPLVIDRLLTTDEIVDFGRKKYLLLQYLLRGVPVEEAALKLDVPLDEALRFKESSKAKTYLEDRELAAIIAQEAKNEDRWWVRAETVLQGKKALSKAQVELMKEVGRRVSPVASEVGTTHKIEIIIDPEAVARSRERRQAIEAEIIQEQAHG